jgi:hypothetical protein
MLLNIPGPDVNGIPGRAVRAAVIYGGYRFITIQVVGPGSIRIGTQQSEVEQGQAGAFDGIEIVANLWPTFQSWWKDDLWIIAENANAVVRLIIPGYTGGNKT